MLLSSIGYLMHRCSDAEPYPPTTPPPPTEPRLARPEPRRRRAENLSDSPVFGPSTRSLRGEEGEGAVEVDLAVGEDLREGGNSVPDFSDAVVRHRSIHNASSMP